MNGYFEQVASAGDSNIEPFPFGMLRINVFSGRSTQALHAIIRTSEQQSTECVDCEVNPQIHALDFAAAPAEDLDKA